MNAKSPAQDRRSARERLLSAADELFYEFGVNTVGIDRVIERAGVAKASLYDCFGSKEELIRSYLQARFEVRQGRLLKRLTEVAAPRDKILAIFDTMAEIAADTNFRGCAFARASAEREVGDKVKNVCDSARAWTLALFTRHAAEAGAENPEELGCQLRLLYDGVSVAAQMEGHRQAASAALAARRAAAERLAALLPARGRSKPKAPRTR